jgi:hypothetical protein
MDASTRQLRLQARQLRGVAIARVARELGLSKQCLGRWLRGQPGSAPLRRVAVAPAPEAPPRPAARLVLFTPQGHRVEGLDHDGLIAVLRALA